MTVIMIAVVNLVAGSDKRQYKKISIFTAMISVRARLRPDLRCSFEPSRPYVSRADAIEILILDSWKAYPPLDRS